MSSTPASATPTASPTTKTNATRSKSTTKRVYTQEYRIEAVKLVINANMNLTAAANKLGLSVKTYSNWVQQARAGTLTAIDGYRLQPVTDLHAEISRLKRELATACEERDVLKKATAYFAKLSK
jgi:transposase